MAWPVVVELGLLRHDDEGSYDSAVGLAAVLDQTHSILQDTLSRSEEDSMQILLRVAELVVRLFTRHAHHADVVHPAAFRMTRNCAQLNASVFRKAATVIAPHTVQHCSNPSFEVAASAQACLHALTTHCGYDLRPVLARCHSEKDCFHFSRQVALIAKTWRPDHVLPHHDAIVQVLGTCVHSVGYVTRWYGYDGLCALFAFQREHQLAAPSAASYLAGLTEFNKQELIAHFPSSSLVQYLQAPLSPASISSISTVRTSALSESTDASDTNQSLSSPNPTNAPRPMLSVFLQQIKDQHAWSTTQAALAADSTLREQYLPLLDVAKLRAEALDDANVPRHPEAL